MKRKKVVEVDLTRIEDTFKKMNNEKAQVGLSLLEEVAFMRETLIKMRKDITESSLTSEYNGYQRSNPIIAGYNAMINNYSKLTRQLADLLPKEEKYYNAFEEDDLDTFIEE